MRVASTSLALALLLSFAPSAHAGIKTRPDSTGQSLPPALNDVGIEDRRGNQLPLQEIRLRDEQGTTRPLAEYLRPGRPVLLNLVYFGCPGLCTYVINGVTDALAPMDWNIGEKFDVLSVSIDAREGADLASAKKDAYLEKYVDQRIALRGPKDLDQEGRAALRRGASEGWRFLTGDAADVKRLADAVGFKFKWVEAEQQFAHGAAIFLLTPTGVLSRTLYGVMFEPRDMRIGLLEASNGKIGNVVDRLLLFCYHYDPKGKGYALAASRLMSAGGAGTVLAFAGGYLIWFRRRRREPLNSSGTSSK